MMSFLSLMSDIFGNLYKLLRDSKVADILGVDLFWALFGFFVMWVALNIFVFRPIVNPGSLLAVLPRSESPEAEVIVRERVHLSHGRDKKGKPVDRVSRSRTYTDREGNSYTESWDS